MSTGLLLALVCGIFVAYLNGANDVSKGIATLAGSGVTNYRRAILWGSVWTGAGCLASSIASKAMIGTFGAGLLREGVQPTLEGALAVLLGAAACVGTATHLGLPVSTTHAIVGSVAGVYSYTLGFAGVNWGTLGGKVVLPLLASPFLALLLVLAILVAGRLVAKRLGEAPDCFCIDVQPAPLPASLVVEGSSLAVSQSTTQVDIAVGSVEACATERPLTLRITATHLHWFTSGATSFARGLNDTPKIVALVLVALALASGRSTGQSYAFATVTLAMVARSWMAGKKVTRALAEEVTPMDHQEGFIANLVTAGLVGPGAALGLPMSTTHVSTGAIIGVGALKKAELNWKAVQSMFLAWVLTIPLAAVLGIIAFTVLQVLHGNNLAW